MATLECYPLGIIGAMEVEVEELVSWMDVAETIEAMGTRFYCGTLEGTDVVIVRSGIGKVRAAMCAQVLVDLFGVSAVINTGVAGALDARLDVCDFVVADCACYHDVDATALGVMPGLLPDHTDRDFAADPELRDLAVAAVYDVSPESQVVVGRVVSGDQFIAGADIKEHLISEFGGACCEMEGAAIAHACYENGVPYAIVRAISDKADGSAHVSYNEFEKEAADLCAKIVCDVCRGLAS